MSKSLGTGIDPLDLIAKHGADATRYGLLKMSSTQDVRFSEGPLEEGRKLANKLWNVSRLLLLNRVEPEARPREVEERWILARLDATRAELEQAWAAFDFSHSVQSLYRLTFDDFCDWYAEAIKPRLREGDEDAAATALAALERLLSLLHPVMPHVTEEIWSNLPGRESRLIVAAWPEPDESFASDVGALDRVQEAAGIFRRSGVLVELEGDEQRIFSAVVKPKRVRANGNEEAERERLRKEISRAEGMLANERFVANAPEDVVAGEREKLERYRRELDALGG
jgi:valyl-tRNA synthetase